MKKKVQTARSEKATEALTVHTVHSRSELPSEHASECAAEELRSLRIYSFLKNSVPARHHKALLHLPDVHSSIQLRARVHEQIHALQPSFTRHQVKQNLGHRAAIHGGVVLPG